MKRAHRRAHLFLWTALPLLLALVLAWARFA